MWSCVFCGILPGQKKVCVSRQTHFSIEFNKIFLYHSIWKIVRDLFFLGVVPRDRKSDVMQYLLYSRYERIYYTHTIYCIKYFQKAFSLNHATDIHHLWWTITSISRKIIVFPSCLLSTL